MVAVVYKRSSSVASSAIWVAEEALGAAGAVVGLVVVVEVLVAALAVVAALVAAAPVAVGRINIVPKSGRCHWLLGFSASIRTQQNSYD